jgi:hypothetical protein
VRIGETGIVGDTSVTPSEVIEDSRCPLGVMCIQAGRVRIDAAVHVGKERTKQTFLIGAPFTFSGRLITLTAVGPIRKRGDAIAAPDYVLTFKVEAVPVEYTGSAKDMIRLSSPPIGAVVGKIFEVRGQARGTWFFEASFPVVVLDAKGNVLAQAVAKAGSDWMTTDFVPFSSSITIPDTYIGEAVVVLKKDNPSGLPEKDASMSFPIHIEY